MKSGINRTLSGTAKIREPVDGPICDHFPGVRKMVDHRSGSQREVADGTV